MKKLLLFGLFAFLASSVQAVVSINGAQTIVGSVTIQGTFPILSTTTLQSGATFYVPYGNLNSQLLIGNPANAGLDSIRVQPSLLTYYAAFATLNPFMTLKFSNTNAGALRAGVSFCSGDSCAGSDGYASRVMLIAPTQIQMARTVTISSATTISDSLTVSSGTIHNGFHQLFSRTSAQINVLIPGSVMQEYGCSDCATVPVCISTGTAIGAFSLITNKGSSCQ